MTTVANIAKAAFDGASSAISDSVLSGVLSDGTTTYVGRVVFGGETAPSGFPIAKAKDKVRPAYLEGFSAVAEIGWTIIADGVTYFIVGVRDIVEAGGLIVVNVIARGDMVWKSATFERKTNVADGSGGYGQTWATLATADIGMMALSGIERWASDRVESQARWRAVAMHVTGLKDADRVTVGGVSYRITFIDDVERRGLWHVLDLTEGAAT